MAACGLDFGTSNSALGVVGDSGPELAPVEGAATIIPSAIFFDFESQGRVVFGEAAIGLYIGQQEGRLMRSLKSILGSPLIDEKTAVGHKRIALNEVVELFIRHLKSRAEAFLGEEITQVVHGRPVRFVDGDDAADARAQSVLEEIARHVGFREIAFLFEPLAAAYHYEETAEREELVLVADIGGGTSDFSVIRIGPERRSLPDRRPDILANAGIRIGGTDFDTAFSLTTVMPLLGFGSRLMGKDLPMPKSIYFELATWATINFVYGYRSEREVRALLAEACEPDKVARLLKTVRRHLGHRIAFAVEDAKIALSDEPAVSIPLDFLERSLVAGATQEGFSQTITEKTERLTRVASGCIAAAGVSASRIETVFLTGGSSRVPAVRRAISAAAPSAHLTSGSDLLSVALGLTREAQRRFG
jgi:hypothetical chaperone protein